MHQSRQNFLSVTLGHSKGSIKVCKWQQHHFFSQLSPEKLTNTIATKASMIEKVFLSDIFSLKSKALKKVAAMMMPIFTTVKAVDDSMVPDFSPLRKSKIEK